MINEVQAHGVPAVPKFAGMTRWRFSFVNGLFVSTLTFGRVSD